MRLIAVSTTPVGDMQSAVKIRLLVVLVIRILEIKRGDQEEANVIGWEATRSICAGRIVGEMRLCDGVKAILASEISAARGRS
jgi:hypothetical protein